MATRIKLKRSTTAATVPTTSNLEDGEVAVNIADRKIYVRNGASVVEVANHTLEKNKNLAKNFKSLAKDITLFGTNKTKGNFANKMIDQYKNSKKLFIITVVPNQIYCLAGYWIEEISPGKFESIFYEKTKQKINEYKNTKKEVDKFIKEINLEYKSIKKEINDFF